MRAPWSIIPAVCLLINASCSNEHTSPTYTAPPGLRLGNLAGQCSTPSFSEGASVVATNPGYLAAADFNRDGRLDLVVAEGAPSLSGNSPHVQILLGDGDGGFVTATFLFANFPEFVLAEDLDRDGATDLAVANPALDRISVLLGGRKGNFEAPSPLVAGPGAGAIATGDFNRDGAIDLAVANKSSEFVSILIGDGQGSFDAPTEFSIGPLSLETISVTAADFDHDGKLDLAVVTGDVGDVVLLLGDGRGSFSAPRSTFANFPEFVLARDLNRDGTVDLLVANPGPDQVSLLLGKGDGNFAQPKRFAAGLQPRSLATGDFNKDGRVDVAVANASSDNVSILLGDGAGDFAAPVNVPASDGPWSVVAGDFNQDGRLDLAVGVLNTGSLLMLLNTCGINPSSS